MRNYNLSDFTTQELLLRRKQVYGLVLVSSIVSVMMLILVSLFLAKGNELAIFVIALASLFSFLPGIFKLIEIRQELRAREHRMI